MNWPTSEEIKEFSKSYSDEVFVQHICESFVDIIKAKNPKTDNCINCIGFGWVTTNNGKNILWYIPVSEILEMLQ